MNTSKRGDDMAGSSGLDKECFFIAPIGDEGSDVRRRSDGVLAAIVEPAAAAVGLTAVRADGLAKPGQITLQVIEHVLGARSAVADLTGKNANVLYELGIRHAARLPVILIAEAGESLPFDAAQMRTIFFRHTDLESAVACERDLVRQLQQALEGNFDSPVSTALDILSLRSGNTLQRTMAKVLDVLGEVSGDLGEARREISRMGRTTAYQPVDLPILMLIRALGVTFQEAIDVARDLNQLELVSDLEMAREPIGYLLSVGPRLAERDSIPTPRETASRPLIQLESTLLSVMRAAPKGCSDLDRALSRADALLAALMDFAGLDYERHRIDSVRQRASVVQMVDGPRTTAAVAPD